MLFVSFVDKKTGFPEMNLSALFIYKPVATTLLTIAIFLVGVLAFLNLPVSSLP